MALARATLIASVSAELAGVLTLAGFTSADTTGNMKEPADRTFRALDVAEVDLATASVASGGERQAIAYLSYFALLKAVRETALKMDVAAGGASAKLSQQYDHLKDMLALALAEAQSYGLTIPGLGQSGLNPIPYAGGIDLAEFEANAADTSLVPALFSRDDLPSIPRTPAWDWGEW